VERTAHFAPEQIFKERRFFLSNFPHRLELTRSEPEAEILPHETKSDWKKDNTSQKNLF